jgi:hypothetical protein
MKLCICLLFITAAFAEEINFVPASTPQSTYREFQFENETARVWKTTIMPFSPLKLHRHDNPRIMVGLQGGVLKRITERGEISYLNFETDKAIWLDADPPGELHADINESSDPIIVMVIEMKH